MHETQALERYYNSFIDLSGPREFFLGLGGYLSYALSVPVFRRFAEEQLAERDTKYEEIERTELRVLEELRSAKEKLIAVIKKVGVDTTSFERHNTHRREPYNNIVDELNAVEKGEMPQIRADFTSNELEDYLFDIAANLLRLGCEKEIAEFVVPKEEYQEYLRRIHGEGRYIITGNEHGSFIFSKVLPSRYELVALVEQERRIKLWGHFEILLQFKETYDAVSKNTDPWSIINEELKGRDLFTTMISIEKMKVAQMTAELNFLIGNSDHDSLPISPSNRPGATVEEKLWELKKGRFRSAANAAHNSWMTIGEKEREEVVKPKYPKSIHLVVDSLEPSGAIWLILDEHFETPIRFSARNKKGGASAIKLLHNIAYFINASDKTVSYDRGVAHNINNGLFKNKRVSEYLKMNRLEKPTLVQKSEDGKILVLKNEVPVKTSLIKNIVPEQYKSLYIDKTR